MSGISPLLLASPWSAALVEWVVLLAIVTIGLGMLLCIIRLLRGPDLPDRALALDTLGIHLIGFVILLSIRIRTSSFLDGVLVLSLLGFAGTVALSQFIMRVQLRRRRGKPPGPQTPEEG